VPSHAQQGKYIYTRAVRVPEILEMTDCESIDFLTSFDCYVIYTWMIRKSFVIHLWITVLFIHTRMILLNI